MPGVQCRRLSKPIGMQRSWSQITASCADRCYHSAHTRCIARDIICAGVCMQRVTIRSPLLALAYRDAPAHALMQTVCQCSANATRFLPSSCTSLCSRIGFNVIRSCSPPGKATPQHSSTRSAACRSCRHLCARRDCGAALQCTHAVSASRHSRLQDHCPGHTSKTRWLDHSRGALVCQAGWRDSHPQSRRSTGSCCNGMGH